jgi:hypothetical protein
MITCDQCRDDLAEYALGDADGAQRDRLELHLSACPVCRQELEQLQAAWASLPLTLTPLQPSRGLYDHVLERIERAALTLPLEQHPPGRRERFLSYAVAAAVFLGLTAGLWRLAQPSADDVAARRNAEQLAERLGNLQEMERLLADKNVRVVSLHSPQPSNPAEAYLVWDLAARQWHFYADNLPAPPPGSVYQLWIAPAQGDAAAGPTFTVDDQGLGSVIVDLPRLQAQEPNRATVTLEPAGGSSQPTGKVVLEAAF